MDADLAQKTPTVESDNGRKALGSKEFGIARGSILKPKTGENALGPALSQNSTPRSRFDRKPISNVFSDEREEPVFQPHPETSVFSAVEEPENTGINASQPAKFTPFSNAQPFRYLASLQRMRTRFLHHRPDRLALSPLSIPKTPPLLAARFLANVHHYGHLLPRRRKYTSTRRTVSLIMMKAKRMKATKN